MKVVEDEGGGGEKQRGISRSNFNT